MVSDHRPVMRTWCVKSPHELELDNKNHLVPDRRDRWLGRAVRLADTFTRCYCGHPSRPDLLLSCLFDLRNIDVQPSWPSKYFNEDICGMTGNGSLDGSVETF